MAQIAVEIRSKPLQIATAWEDLAARAAVNVFMHPVALNAVHVTAFARLHTLLAWDESVMPKRLVGLWALQAKRLAPLLPGVLAAPPYDYAFVSDPVLDPDCMDQAAGALLDAIESAPALPKVLRLRYLDGDSEAFRAIQRALIERGSTAVTLAERERPFVSRELGFKSTGSTRKKLRQDWNRLAAAGAVEVVNERTPGAVRQTFETFLDLEAASWKGARGTALLCRERDSTFARRMIGDLADQQCASVATLRLDGRVIAAQVLLYCGRTAYTWKTAFDATFARYSPGMLLIDRITEQLLVGGAVDAMESCSPDGGFMGQLWAGRRTTVDQLVQMGQGASTHFAVAKLAERAYAQARAVRNRLRTRARRRVGKRRVAPVHHPAS